MAIVVICFLICMFSFIGSMHIHSMIGFKLMDAKISKQSAEKYENRLVGFNCFVFIVSIWVALAQVI